MIQAGTEDKGRGSCEGERKGKREEKDGVGGGGPWIRKVSGVGPF